MIKSTRYCIPSDKYITSVQVGGHHEELKGWEEALLKNVGAKLNFEGRLGLVGDLGDKGILRTHDSDFLEKQDDSSELQRLSLPPY